MADETSDHAGVDGSVGFGMTDLEEVLRQPGGSDVSKTLLERFSALDAALSSRIDGGLSPEAFARATIIRNSLAAASNILIRIPKG